MWSYLEFGPVVQEENLLKKKVYGRRTKSDNNSWKLFLINIIRKRSSVEAMAGEVV